MTIYVTWPDGALTTAADWQDLETQVRAVQWSEMSPREFRRTMRKRAINLHGMNAAAIPIDTPEGLFRGLERFDMLRLDVTEAEQ